MRRPKALTKFLDLLYHQLGSLFRESSIVARIPNAAWGQSAFRFRPPDEFGVPATTFRDAYADGGQNELVITTDGRYGYWRDETYADSETLVVANVSDPGPPIRS